MLMLLDAMAFELDGVLAVAGLAARILFYWTLVSILAATLWSVALWRQPRDD